MLIPTSRHITSQIYFDHSWSFHNAHDVFALSVTYAKSMHHTTLDLFIGPSEHITDEFVYKVADFQKFDATFMFDVYSC